MAKSDLAGRTIGCRVVVSPELCGPRPGCYRHGNEHRHGAPFPQATRAPYHGDRRRSTRRQVLAPCEQRPLLRVHQSHLPGISAGTANPMACPPTASSQSPRAAAQARGCRWHAAAGSPYRQVQGHGDDPHRPDQPDRRRGTYRRAGVTSRGPPTRYSTKH